MNEIKKCGCGGMNDECMYCGGTGSIIQHPVEIVKTNPTKSELLKEKEDLNNYLHPNNEKLYVSNKPYKNKYLEKIHFKLQSDKAKKPKPAIYVSDSFSKIGPGNPNRLKIGDTRNLGVKKNIAIKRKK